MIIKNIKINGLYQPVGIDEKNPHISWELDSDQENVIQKEIQLQIRDKEQNIWNFQQETCEQQIKYTGPKLLPCTRYELDVKVKDSAGEVSHGETSFETGFLNEKQWSASWISPCREKRQSLSPEGMTPSIMGGEEIPKDSMEDLYPVVYFEKKICNFGKKVIRARLYITARGVYEAQIDGKKVGNMELAPEFTAYDKYIQYQTYDVTEALQGNDHCMRILLGDGYYIGRIGIMGFGYEYGDNTALLFQLEIQYEDETVQTLVSDEKCLYGETNIEYSDVFIGEMQNLQKEWEDAVHIPLVNEFDNCILSGQAAEPLMITKRIRAKRIITTPAGETVIDFGQVLAGKTEITLQGKGGEKVTFEHQEVLDEKGNFFFNIGRFNCEMQTVYILKEGKQILHPVFAVQGFRYVRVTGYEGELQPENCIALVIGSACEKTGSFQCSDERLNQLQHNIFWSQKSNFFSIPMDCPQRERAGWTGDIQVYIPTACFNMNVYAFMRRWLKQMRAEQTAAGAIPVVVPYSPGYKAMQKNILQFFKGCPQGSEDTSSGWGEAAVVVPWTLYQYYGDRGILEENYDMMEKWLAYIEKQTNDFIWDSGFHFGDWLYPSAKNEDGTADAFLSASSTSKYTAPLMYAYDVQLMIEVCRVLGKEGRARELEVLNTNIKQAFCQRYLDENGRLPAELQGIYVLALRMGIFEGIRKEKAVNHLVQLIQENGGCLDTGFVSVPFLMDVLYENGKEKEAFELLYQEKCPSWLYEIKMGATTIWESWDGIRPDGRPRETSYNHYAFGCVGDWIYRTILGMRRMEAGYQKMKIQPDLSCKLDWVKGSYHSVYGEIEVSWRKTNGKAVLETVIPVGTEAELVLKTDSETIIKQVGSGRYKLEARL